MGLVERHGCGEVRGQVYFIDRIQSQYGERRCKRRQPSERVCEKDGQSTEKAAEIMMRVGFDNGVTRKYGGIGEGTVVVGVGGEREFSFRIGTRAPMDVGCARPAIPKNNRRHAWTQRVAVLL